MGLLAERVGVRTPSLYKHVGGQEDLNRRIAARAHEDAERPAERQHAPSGQGGAVERCAAVPS
ncbi:hypothetical protein ACWC2H_43205, partial [Streptomyces sp. 900105755]